MKCKSKELVVKGIEYNDVMNKARFKELRVICTNDEKGKTLSVDNGIIQFSIPMEDIIECFKGDYKK